MTRKCWNDKTKLFISCDGVLGFASDDDDDDERSSKGKPESVLPELSSDEEGDGRKNRAA